MKDYSVATVKNEVSKVREKPLFQRLIIRPNEKWKMRNMRQKDEMDFREIELQ